ncbi:MAG: DUF3843 family protein [Prevotellaceae bacterium]|jgi:hypothetical protein|nr:DUF3843 family protein [Prevotellaceae bacterium]
MKIINQKFNSTIVTRKDWQLFHPISSISAADVYYVNLCNKVLKIIKQSKIIYLLENKEEVKTLACVLVAYFEDVISETHLFSTFTKKHNEMYSMRLPFYEITEEYYDDEINRPDIAFLIWYYVALRDEEYVTDPFFEENQSVDAAISAIYDLFDREFENAPINENLKEFLQLPTNPDVATVREKLEFIALKSYLFQDVFSRFFDNVLEKNELKNTLVKSERDKHLLYDCRVHFIFNEFMPLLAMRANEYYAEVLGSQHCEYQFIKNISERKTACFILRKIEENGYHLEHIPSKTKIFVSDEFFDFGDNKLIENQTVLNTGIVKWKDDVWQTMGICMLYTIDDFEGEKIGSNVFDDENKKQEIIKNQQVTFYKLTQNKQIIFKKGVDEYADFNQKLIRMQSRANRQDLNEKDFNELFEKTFRNITESPFDDECFTIFYNPKSGIELYSPHLTVCINSADNPFYDGSVLDVERLAIDPTISTEFICFLLENELIELGIDESYNEKYMFTVIMENLDFLMRFYKKSEYFAKLEVSIVYT